MDGMETPAGERFCQLQERFPFDTIDSDSLPVNSNNKKCGTVIFGAPKFSDASYKSQWAIVRLCSHWFQRHAVGLTASWHSMATISLGSNCYSSITTENM